MNYDQKITALRQAILDSRILVSKWHDELRKEKSETPIVVELDGFKTQCIELVEKNILSLKQFVADVEKTNLLLQQTPLKEFAKYNDNGHLIPCGCLQCAI